MSMYEYPPDGKNCCFRSFLKGVLFHGLIRYLVLKAHHEAVLDFLDVVVRAVQLIPVVVALHHHLVEQLLELVRLLGDNRALEHLVVDLRLKKIRRRAVIDSQRSQLLRLHCTCILF